MLQRFHDRPGLLLLRLPADRGSPAGLCAQQVSAAAARACNGAGEQDPKQLIAVLGVCPTVQRPWPLQARPSLWLAAPSTQQQRQRPTSCAHAQSEHTSHSPTASDGSFPDTQWMIRIAARMFGCRGRWAAGARAPTQQRRFSQMPSPTRGAEVGGEHILRLSLEFVMANVRDLTAKSRLQRESLESWTFKAPPREHMRHDRSPYSMRTM